MKKIVTILLISLLAASATFAQNAKPLLKENASPGRAITDLTCPSGSLYSQVPDGLNAWSTINGYYLCDNVITAPTGPVASITFWMLELVPFNPLNVDIHFRQNSGGVPGTDIATFPGLMLPGIPTGEFFSGFPVLSYTYVLPTPITLAAGDWVGIADYPDTDHHHYWLTSSSGDNSMYLTNGEVQPNDLAFCLGGANPSEVPLSPVAIVIAIALIASTVLIRNRRYFL
jgi:hypothetical protein